MINIIGNIINKGYGGSSFDPNTITGLKAWIDFTDQTKVSTSAGLITQVLDKSVNGINVTQGTAGNRPTYNTAGALAFGRFANGKTLLNATLAQAQPYTIYTVMRQITAGNNLAVLQLAPSGFTGLYQVNGSGYNYIAAANGASFVPYRTGNSYSTSTSILKYVINGINTTCSVNLEPFNDTDFSPGTTAISQLQIGGTTGFDIFELLIVSGVTSSTDDKNIRNYLASKYSIGTSSSIMSFGDSITFGQMPGFSSSYMYLTAVARGYHFYNFAVSGTQVTGGGNNLDNKVLNKAPSDPAWNTGWVTFNFGANGADFDANPVTWKASYKASIQVIIDAGFAKNRIILLTPYYNTAETNYVTMVPIIRDIASELGVVLGDLYLYTQANGGDSLIGDGVHPTAAGHIVGSTFMQTLIP